jgi:dienelactone hydrolase
MARAHPAGRSLRTLTFTALCLAVQTMSAALFAAPGAPPPYLGALPPGTLTSAIPTLADPTQTWELFLPKSYSPDRQWPVLILFDPRARGQLAVELFRDAADELGWILASSNNTRSDGPAEPNARAVNAMIPDVMKRLPVDPRRVYAGGFSGGAVLAWTVGLKGGFLAGVISVGGRPAPEQMALVPRFALFSTAGDTDFNFQATRELDAIAARAGVPHRLEIFPGPHAWCPPGPARAALVWLEVLAMRDGLAARDAALIDRALGEEMAAADSLAEAGDALGASRKLAEIGATFAGVGASDVLAKAAERSRQLLASTAAKNAAKEEKAAEKYENQHLRQISVAAARLRAAESRVAIGDLRHLLGIDEALRRREAGGEAGAAAARVLETIRVQLGDYLVRELFAADDYRRALPALELVSGIFPESGLLRYNLACAQARSGHPQAALVSLAAALEAGLPEPLQLATDDDLVSLRDRPEFARLVDRARALEAPVPAPTP